MSPFFYFLIWPDHVIHFVLHSQAIFATILLRLKKEMLIMPVSVRLDEETEALLNKTAKTLRTTKSKVLKASVQDFCKKTLQEKRKKPYDLISDLIGKEYSGDGNLAINAEEILRKRFSEKSGLGKKNDPS
jgi:hypothetical protein